jgi:PAS domain S-box-containing protein
MKFSEIIQVGELQSLCDSFTAITGMVTAILDLNGNILVASGWQDVCTKFHRVNPATAARCRESDTALAGQLGNGQAYNVYKCKNGLVDVAVPIIIGGEHVGNFFTGQFFFEKPDEDFFSRQADEFGFDRDSYFGALDKAPIFSEDKVRVVMEFFTRLARLVGEMGLANMKQLQSNIELRNSQRLLKAVIDTVPMRVFWKDRDLRYLGCNPAFSFDAGKAGPDDVVGEDDYQMAWAKQADMYREDDRSVIESNTPKLFYDEPITTQDGRMSWVRTSKVPLKNQENEIVGILGIFEDITERKQAEDTFRKLFEDSSDAIFLIDSAGVFVECNQAALNILKMTKGQLLLQPPAKISPEFQPDGRRSSEAAVEMIGLAYSNGLQRFDWTCINNDGGEFIVEVSYMPIAVKGQTMLHATWRDITERKHVEKRLRDMNERLERSNTELESFAYVAAHDLREPLRNVTTFSSLLERRLGDRLGGEEREFLQIVKDAAFRMDALVGDLLGLSQVGRAEMGMEVVSVTDVVDQALQSLQARISESQANVIIETSLPNVIGNRNELYQVFLNLIANAIKYSGNDASVLIRIRCADDGKIWHFQVQDNGIGIEAGCGYEERIFKLFQRLHQRDEYGGGTGVGLAICRKAVERHGGRIWVESEGQGKGSTFHVTLPKA